jgi:D-alanyl-D-alanine carboxypeptidase
MLRTGSRLAVLSACALLVAALAPTAAGAGAQSADAADAALDKAMAQLVAKRDGPPGVAAVVQRVDDVQLHQAGTADLATDAPFAIDDFMRMASVAKAFSGAAALAVVADGQLALTDTIGDRLPDLPEAWHDITLAQLLQHTSGLPDFSDEDSFREAVAADPLTPPPPVQLLSYVEDLPLNFDPGTKFRYSNTDNIAVGLMVEAATGRNYADVLTEKVYGPLGLTATSLPEGADLPTPYIHGYFIEPGSPPEDASVGVFAAGWAWASGGIVATPADANRFVRGYAAGKTTDEATHTAQFKFVKGHSEPTGPGKNTAGLGIFRYKTKCGTVYGHTGNTPGYTQFVASTKDGTRSATVTATMVLTQRSDAKMFPALRKVFEAATCAALAE